MNHDRRSGPSTALNIVCRLVTGNTRPCLKFAPFNADDRLIQSDSSSCPSMTRKWRAEFLLILSAQFATIRLVAALRILTDELAVHFLLIWPRDTDQLIRHEAVPSLAGRWLVKRSALHSS